ncbi:flavoredoxin [Lachnospiraceae bacterium KM106-2]|nr:flavoredoxin [Lachnospiraceae bacterium KM106-2]
MKKNIGKALSLYPLPTLVIGAMVNGKPTWTLVAHAGIMGHDHVMVSLSQVHYINQGIKESNTLSINVVDESWLDKADHMGCVSGNKVDKSESFEYTIGEKGTPMINDAKLSIECEVEADYNTPGFDNFICTIAGTYAEEAILNEKGKINYHTFKPVLFEMPTYEYFRMGDVIGNCMKIEKKNA